MRLDPPKNIMTNGLLMLIAAAAGAAALIFLTELPSQARTVADVLSRYGPDAEKRLAPFFKEAKIAYPPKSISLLGFKEEKRLELWANTGAGPVWIRNYSIKRASGKSGPKLREGDRQVPEGLYRIVVLNPNSSYHLSLKINYPNEFDRKQARLDGRRSLGGDIFIHGKAVSIGCLAMGDEAIEELFTLTGRIGRENVTVVLAPRDFRQAPPGPGETKSPPWTKALYSSIDKELQRYPRRDAR